VILQYTLLRFEGTQVIDASQVLSKSGRYLRHGDPGEGEREHGLVPCESG
jgi:hypothetical protein